MIGSFLKYYKFFLIVLFIIGLTTPGVSYGQAPKVDVTTADQKDTPAIKQATGENANVQLAGVTAGPDSGTDENKKKIEKISRAQMPFIANEGQLGNKSVRFFARISEGMVFVTKDDELVYSLPMLESSKNRRGEKGLRNRVRDKSLLHKTTKGWTLKESLLDAINMEPQGVDEVQTKVNYFTGVDKTKWQKNFTTYNMVSLGEVYPGIDLSVSAHENNVEKIFTINPGADVDKIKLKLDGASSLAVNDKGELEISTRLGTVCFTKPVAYQVKNGKREYVPVSYYLGKDFYGFTVGVYDKSLPLIIDPLLASTYDTNPGVASVNTAVYGSTGSPAWPRLSYNNSNTSISPYACSPSAVKWAIKLDDFGGKDNCTFREAPVIGRNNIVFISADSWTTKEFSVYAIYPDGKLKWRRVLSATGDYNNYSSLTLSNNGCLYIGTNGNGKLYCIDEETGAVNWTYTAPSGPPGATYPHNDIYSPPIIHPVTGDILFSTWEMICLDNNGNRRWGYYAGANIDEHFAAISPYNGWIYFCDWGLPGNPRGNTRIQAVDINGNLKCSYTFPNNWYNSDPYCGDRSAPIILSNGNILISGDSDVCYSLTPDLKPIWTANFVNSPYCCSITPMALSPDESICYLQSWGWGPPSISAVKVATGEILWDVDFSAQVNAKLGLNYTYEQESGLVVEAGGKVLVNAYTNEVNKQVLFTMNSSGVVVDAVLIETPDGIESSTQPSIAPDGTVYLGDYYSGYVVAVSSKSIDDKPILGKRSYCLYGKGSVNLSNGNFIQERTDLVLPSIGPSLEFTRFYNSKDTYTGPQGKGWTHNYNTNLTINKDGSITVAYADGHTALFTCNGSSYLHPAGCFETLAAGPNNTYILTFKDQTTYTYNAAGQLTSITDKNGNTLTLTYTNGLLSAATEPAGRSFTFTYDANNHLTGVADTAGRSVSYTYDSGGNLATLQDVLGGTTQYHYDTQGLTEIIAPDGNTLLRNTYDSSSRVTQQTDGSGNITGFNYDQANQQTAMTDALGNTITAGYDGRYRSTGITYPGNITETFAYDNNNCRASVTDAVYHTTTCSYDDLGNLLTVTDPAGNTTKMTYDGSNNLLSVTNAAGKQINFTYDANNNLTAMTDPLGNTTTYTYDSSGFLLSKTTPGPDPGPGKTSYTYQSGLPQTVTDPAGNTTTYSYDPTGRPNSITDADGKKTAMSYDPADNLTGVTDPLGNTTSFTYDWHHNILTKTDARGNTTHYTYNGNGKLINRVDALNNATSYEYDGDNHLTKITDARGNATKYSYDALGRLTGVTDPLGHTTSSQYDAVGNITGKTDALGKKVLAVSYDSLNNPQTVTDALGNKAANQYDSLSRLTGFTDPVGNVTQFNYDDLNRLKSTTDSLNGQGSQDFDAHSNRTALVDPNSNKTSFSYDIADRLMAKTSAASGSTTLGYNARNLVAQKTNARGQTTTYQYDAVGRLTSFTNPDGTVSFTYDQNGNLLTAADSAGTTVREYDALNRMVKYKDTQGNTVEYAYDAVGNLITLTYPGGRQVQYQYNATNRLVKVTDWAGRITSYEYDPNGRLVKTVNPNGTSTTRAYDDAGRLIQMKDVDNSGGIISQYDYTYDTSSYITEEKNSSENVSLTTNDAVLTYSADNRLASYNGQAAVYDADGNMTTGPLSGNMVNFTCDARNRLISAGNLSYRYDAENNRISVKDSVYNAQTSYVINTNAPFSQVLISSDGQGKQTFYVYGLGLIGQESPDGSYRTYHFDLRGSTVALTDNSGKVTDSFRYTPYGILGYRTGNTVTPFLFVGRYGVMTDASDLYYMRARYYNPVVKRFLSPDKILGYLINPQSLNLYIYCEGNPANYVDPTGHATLDRFSDGVYYYHASDKTIDTFEAYAGAIPFIGLAVPVADKINSWIGPYQETINLKDKRQVQAILGNISTAGTYLGYIQQVFNVLGEGKQLLSTASKVSGILSWVGTGAGYIQGTLDLFDKSYDVEKAVELSHTIGWDTKEKAVMMAIFAENAMDEMLTKGQVSIVKDEYGVEKLEWNDEDAEKTYYDAIWKIKSGE